MKLMFINNLVGGEVLAKNILSNDGRTLLKSGSILTTEYINKLRNLGVFFVYVLDDSLEDITDDKRLSELKQITLQKMPGLFRDLINGNERMAKEALGTCIEMIDHIIAEGNINTNLYEVKTYDNYTYIHCVDTSIMASFLGASLNFHRDDLKELGIGAILHDIGKTLVPNEIINKKGRLTPEEFGEIKKHPKYGESILEKSKIIPDRVVGIVTQHHERIDGKGYPLGLKENEISEFAKIVTVCDVYTAVTANRSYRNRFNPNEAYELILSGANTMFDKKLVEVFRQNFAIYPLGCGVKLSNGIEGFVIRQNKHYPDRPVIRILYDSKTKEPVEYYEIDLVNNINLTIECLI